MAEVDDDQLAALRRLRAASGFVEVVEVIGHDSDDDPIGPPGEPIEGAAMAAPGRMTLEEREQGHTLLTRALTDPNWRTASQALDDLLRKLLVVHRLLEPRSARHSRATDRADVIAAALKRQRR